MKRWWQCMAFVMAVATPGFSQDLAVGTRLRVTRADGKSITGQLAAFDERNFTLDQHNASSDSKQVVVSREEIQSVQISRAPSRKGRGALIGLLAGAVSGAVLGYATGQDCSAQHTDSEPSFSGFSLCIVDRGTAAAGLGVLFGALGAGIGAAAAPGEKWETVGSSHVNVSVIPVRRGAGIGITWLF